MAGAGSASAPDPARAALIVKLGRDLDSKLRTQVRFRAAIREIAQENEMSVLEVRRLLRYHAAAPMP